MNDQNKDIITTNDASLHLDNPISPPGLSKDNKRNSTQVLNTPNKRLKISEDVILNVDTYQSSDIDDYLMSLIPPKRNGLSNHINTHGKSNVPLHPNAPLRLSVPSHVNVLSHTHAPHHSNVTKQTMLNTNAIAHDEKGVNGIDRVQPVKSLSNVTLKNTISPSDAIASRRKVVAKRNVVKNVIHKNTTLEEHFPSKKKDIKPIPFYDEDVNKPIEELDEDEEYVRKLNYIIAWINFRLVEGRFCKKWAGLYLWSIKPTFGKSKLCRVLGKIFDTYNWTFEDDGWQQNWDNNKKCQCVIYDAISSTEIPYRQLESHGDSRDIVVKRRNQRICGKIHENTPFIATSNKHIEDLGYQSMGYEMKPLKARMLSICVNNCPLFPLIEDIEKFYGIEPEVEDKPPDRFYLTEL